MSPIGLSQLHFRVKQCLPLVFPNCTFVPIDDIIKSHYLIKWLQFNQPFPDIFKTHNSLPDAIQKSFSSLIVFIVQLKTAIVLFKKNNGLPNIILHSAQLFCQTFLFQNLIIARRDFGTLWTSNQIHLKKCTCFFFNFINHSQPNSKWRFPGRFFPFLRSLIPNNNSPGVLSLFPFLLF